MKTKEFAELTKSDVKALEDKLAELKQELFALRFQHATNQLDNPMRLTAVRKDIARVKTVLRAKQNNG